MLVWRIWYPLILPQFKISIVHITCLLGLVSILYEEIMSYCQNTNIQSENFHTNRTNFPFFPKANVNFSKKFFPLYIILTYVHTLYLLLTRCLHYIYLHYLQYIYYNIITLVKLNYSWSISVIVCMLIVQVTKKNFVC